MWYMSLFQVTPFMGHPEDGWSIGDSSHPGLIAQRVGLFPRIPHNCVGGHSRLSSGHWQPSDVSRHDDGCHAVNP